MGKRQDLVRRHEVRTPARGSATWLSPKEETALLGKGEETSILLTGSSESKLEQEGHPTPQKGPPQEHTR